MQLTCPETSKSIYATIKNNKCKLVTELKKAEKVHMWEGLNIPLDFAKRITYSFYVVKFIKTSQE